MTRSLRALSLVGGAAVLAVLLAGCTTAAAPRYYSLMPPATPAAASKITPAGAIAWEVLPVSVPVQVDLPQWVLQSADGSLAVLEQERWIAPLADEIRAAVAEQLTRSLGAPAPAGESRKHWRVRIDVQRFDSAPGREVRLEASWSLSAGGEGSPALACRGEFVQAVSAGGYPALAKAHQLGVARLAEAVGRALKSLAAGQAFTCAD